MDKIIQKIKKLIEINQLKQFNFLENSIMESQRQTSTLHIQQNEQASYESESNLKKKMIKKDKIINKISQGKLTKEQKMKIQKQKNRQAAQRSRDQHKEYVNNLEKQIKVLKQQIQTNRGLCSRCRKELDKQEKIVDNIESQLSYEHNLFFQEDQEILEQKQEPQINQDQYYLRIRNQQQDYSYLKMILFIAAIAIAVIIIPTNKDLSGHNRTLLERYQAPSSNTIIPDQFTIHSDETRTIDTHQTQYFTEIHKSLVVKNSILNQQCLDSLLQQKSLTLPNLRSSHGSIRGRDMKNGILLCSFQEHNQKQIVEQQEEQQNFIRMFLLGAQIKQMITGHSPIRKYIESNIQLNGIYKIAAEIKKVELISHHNCLL